MMRVHFRALQCGMKANNIKSQDIVSFIGARGLRVIRSYLLACCSHSRLLSSYNSASQILSGLVTFASASFGFPPAMTKQRNFDDVPFSKPGRAAWTRLSQKALNGMKVATPSLNWTNLSSTFGHGVSLLASDRLPLVARSGYNNIVHCLFPGVSCAQLNPPFQTGCATGVCLTGLWSVRGWTLMCCSETR